MMPNNREVRRMMQRLGVQVEEIKDVIEVRIVTKDKEIEIKGPSVSIVKVQGITSYEITGGQVIEGPRESVQEKEAPVEIKEEDVLLVAAQTGATKEEAERALKETNGDIALAILKLQTRR